MPEFEKQASAMPVPEDGGGGLSWPTPPEICVPGATNSGFLRPSVQGPRLEKDAMSLALFAVEPPRKQPSFPAELLPPLASASDRTLSAAPTVMTFFAVPGAPIVCEF